MTNVTKNGIGEGARSLQNRPCGG